jgi:2-dehydropantoate 2-reductase
MNDDTYVSVVGRERTVGCVIELSAQIFTPGEVQRNTTRTGTWFGLGELDGKVTPRVKELQEILSNVATVDLTENIYGARWTKLTVNSMAMGPFGVLGIKKTDVDDFEGMFELQVKLGKEAFAVASAVGYQIEPVFGLQEDDFAGSDEQVLVTALRTLQRHTGTKSQSASLQDSKKGRKNELEFINGMVSLRGKEVGVPTPCNDAVTEIARRINKGELKMERSNYDLLLKLASEG